MKSFRDLAMPILFFAEGAFWVIVVATGGGPLLLFAALACVLSGVFLLSMPSHWVTRPLAGASALFALLLAIYQVYEATTLVSSNLSSVGIDSGAVFGVFAVVCIYLELGALSMQNDVTVSKKP